MSKFTAEEVEKERKRRQAERDLTSDKQRCINCGQSFSVLNALGWEHGLCNDCLMKNDDE